MGDQFGMIYFAIPEDGHGPAFGPVLNRDLAQTRANAMPGYVVGIEVVYLSWSAIPEDAAGREAPWLS